MGLIVDVLDQPQLIFQYIQDILHPVPEIVEISDKEETDTVSNVDTIDDGAGQFDNEQNSNNATI